MSPDAKNTLMLIIALTLIVCAGCADFVSAELIEHSNELCGNNGGLDRIYNDFYKEYVYCKNGAKFEF